MELAAPEMAQRWPGPPTSPVKAIWPSEAPQLQFAGHGSAGGTVALHRIQEPQQGQREQNAVGAAQQQLPLVLDLLDARGNRISDSVLHVAWADANGAFLLAAATRSSIIVFSLLRYFQWLLGDLDAISNVQGPLAEQLCVVELSKSETICGLDWTHKADGLLCADSSGAVTMLGSVTSDTARRMEDGQLPMMEGLEVLWKGEVSEPQTLLSAGKTAFSPAASAAGSKMVQVWWPPQQPDASLPHPAAAVKQEAAATKAVAEPVGFSSETMAILSSLGGGKVEPVEAVKPPDSTPEADAPAEPDGSNELSMEQLRHTSPVVSVQWSGADLLHGDAGEGDGPAGALLPPAQPALLTMTRDGVMRVWVEVTMAAQQQRPAEGATSPERAPAWGAARGIQGKRSGSHFCVTLVIQPPVGAWDLGRGAPRVCWAVPSGPEPATRPELRAAKVLWIVGLGPAPLPSGPESDAGGGPSAAASADRLLLWAVAGLTGVVIGGRPGSGAASRSARVPRAVLWGQHAGSLVWRSQLSGPRTLSASVTVAEDIPVLRAFEAAGAEHGGNTELRAYRLDTVEDDEAMASSLPLPTSPGSALPPRHLQVHALTQTELLGHASPVSAVLPNEGLNSAVSLGSDGSLLIWRLSPLQPLLSLTLPRSSAEDSSSASASGQFTAVEWLQHSSASQRDRGQCLLAAASSSGVSIFAWRHRQQRLRRAGDVNPTLLTTLALPPSSGVLRWLHQPYQAAGASQEPDIITLLGWIAPEHSECQDQPSRQDKMAVWQIKAQEGGIEGSLVSSAALSGLESSARVTCFASLCGGAQDAVALAGDSAGCLHVVGLEDGGKGVKTLATVSGTERQSAVVALSSACGGARIGAAVASSRLMVYEAQSGVDYALTAVVPLPSEPTDVASLPLPAPAFAVGCTGRGFVVVCRARTGAWQTLAALSPTPLPGATLAPLQPPDLLLAALGNQLEKHRGLSSPSSVPGEGDQSLAELALRVGGPRAPWDPLVIRGLLSRGRRAAAAAALRHLLARLKAVEAAGGSGYSTLEPDADSRPAAAVSAQLLTWARQLSNFLSSPQTHVNSQQQSSRATANGGSIVPREGRSSAQVQGQTPTSASAASVDPFAFNMSSFGGSAGFGTDAPSSAAAAAQDPFAFNMGAFGIPSALGDSYEATAVNSASSMSHEGGDNSALAAAAGAYAFDAGAFGMPGGTQANASNIDEDASANKQGSRTQEGQRAASSADPFAFSIDAFGVGSSSHLNMEEGDSSSNPYAADRGDTGDTSSGHQNVAAAASVADPFAFDPTSFGMEAATEPQSQSSRAEAPVSNKSGSDQVSAEAPSQSAASGRVAAAADPFAFDMGAFGMGGFAAADSAADDTGNDPFASDRHAEVPQSPSAGASDILSGTLDPTAFGMGAAEAAVPSPKRQPPAVSGKSGFERGRAAPDQSSGAGNAERAQRSSQLDALTSYSGGVTKDATTGSAQRSRGMHAKLEAPVRKTYTLSTVELQDLQRLLFLAAGLPSQNTDPEEDGDEEAGGNGLPKLELDSNSISVWLGLERLDRDAVQELLGLASVLAAAQAEPLDEPAQRLLTSLQVALVPQPASNKEAKPAPQRQIIRSSSSLASLLAATRGTTTPGKSEEGGWESNVGLLEAVDMRAVLWALMSASPGALLDACMATVPADTMVEEKQEPKIDFTYSGQKKLDLGFGFGTAKPADAQDSFKQLSWERMRKAGAGFWLTDAIAVRQQAEALAKAQFAAKRDPFDCALMYIALGKRTLLQGLFRSAQHKKQAEFLGRSFTSDKDKAAAAKNAFVLLAQHRPQLAAAFFILAGQLRDAVGVCANELADPQLAIFLCRLLEPAGGPLLQHLLADELLPRALDKQDAWGAAVLEWLLGRPDQALQTLLSSPPAPLMSPQQTQVDRAGAPEEALLLDFLHHCTAAQAASLVPGPATMCTLRTLAQRSAAAFDSAGMPDLALEALALMEAFEQPGGALQSMKTELAASALLRLTIDAGRRASSDAGKAWRTAAQAGLSGLIEKGILLEPEPVLERLGALAALLRPGEAPVLAEEPSTPFSESSSRLSFSRDRRSGSVRAGAGGFAGTLYDGGWVVQQLHDKVFTVCAAQAGDWSGEGRPMVAATAHKGLVELEVTPQQTVDASEAASFSAAASDASSAAKGSVFSALLTDMMEAVRWPAAATLSATSPAMSAAGDNASPRTSPAAPAAGASPRSSPKAATRALLSLTSSSALNPRDSPTAKVSARTDKIATVALASHPFRPLYLSGSATGEIYLWQIGAKQATAGYTPIPATFGAAPPAASASIFATPSRAWNIDRPGALAALGHWGQPQSVCFSEGGERFAAIGQGGMAAAWRLDAPQYTRSDSGPLARSDWCHQVLSKRGVDIAFVGGSSSVLAAGGFCPVGGNIVLWDTLAPISAGPIAYLTHHTPLVTALQVLPGGRLLAAADEAGSVSVSDLRMLGTQRKALLWQAKAGNGGVTCLASGPRPGLASGSREGVITSWAVDSGTALQSIDVSQVQPTSKQAPTPKGYNFFSDVLKSARQSVAPVITGLASCPEGLISSCLDGTIRFHPML